MTAPVVIVEDEVKIAELLRDYCLQAGYEVVMLHDGDAALEWLERNSARILLLDLMLPGADGYTICQAIRRRGSTPIIMITARVEEIDRLLGLELGADDYVCKPFSPREVLARVKAVLRRVESPAGTNSELSLQPDSLQVSANGNTIELTSVEFNLLKTLCASPGRIYSRDYLMSVIYSDDRIVTDRTIDSHVKKLRRKLETLALEADPIHSVYGAGYKYE